MLSQNTLRRIALVLIVAALLTTLVGYDSVGDQFLTEVPWWLRCGMLCG